MTRPTTTRLAAHPKSSTTDAGSSFDTGLTAVVWQLFRPTSQLPPTARVSDAAR
jgi:hypothetical protein